MRRDEYTFGEEGGGKDRGASRGQRQRRRVKEEKRDREEGEKSERKGGQANDHWEWQLARER